MEGQITGGTTPPCLVFDGPLTVRNIVLLQERLLEALQTQARIEIDCSGATEIDLSFLQLLIAARLSAAGQGSTLVCRGPVSGSLHDALIRSGFTGAAADTSPAALSLWLQGEATP